jgi:uncharacterized protein
LATVRVTRAHRAGRPRQRPDRLIADRGYDSNAVRAALAARGIQPIIPARSNNRRATHQDGRCLRRYRRRWIVERSNAWLYNFRRLVVRYERSAEIYTALVHLACALITLKRVFGWPLVIPDEILHATRMSAAELRQEIAVLLFQKEKLTLGQASRLAGLSRVQFQHLLASRQIPVHYDVAEFEEDLQTLQDLRRLWVVIIVSDTSPITNLAVVGHLDLLWQLYERVIIPQAVYSELTSGSGGQPGSVEVQTLGWIETRPVADRALVTALQMELDEGEAEARALAKELAADLLLLDERRGRATAARLNLRVIGLLGVLIEAKQRGFIPAIKPIIDALVVQAGFWVSRPLYARVLRAAGE